MIKNKPLFSKNIYKKEITMENTFKIPHKIEYVINELQNKNYEAYIVGGCVRDILLGVFPNDFDVTTSASPEEIMAIFPKCIPTGIKHGTVTVVYEGESVEVTTFREESGYTDSRRPDSVRFVRSIEKDLLRRDFTVNAMAYNESRGLVDLYGGRADLENKILRAVGNPFERFKEDALRILRLFRFASQLEFKIETETLKASLALKKQLKEISRERIFIELYKTAKGKNPQSILPFLKSGGLKFLGINKIPDFQMMKNCRNNPDLSFFVFIFGGCESISSLLEELKVSNKLKNYCLKLGILKAMPMPLTKAEIKDRLYLAGEEIFRDYLLCCSANNNELSLINSLLDEIIKNNEPYQIADLKISGKTLKRIGFEGEEIGKALEKARKFIIEYPENNSKSELVQFLISQQ